VSEGDPRKIRFFLLEKRKKVLEILGSKEDNIYDLRKIPFMIQGRYSLGRYPTQYTST
jgi:hypothetical protein